MKMIMQEPSQEIMNQDFWKKQYALYKKSGISKAAYCRNNNLIAPRFIYWSHKFEVAETIEAAKSKVSHSANFAKIEISEDKVKSSVSKINPLCILELENAKRLIIHDMAVIKILLNSLGINQDAVGI